MRAAQLANHRQILILSEISLGHPFLGGASGLIPLKKTAIPCFSFSVADLTDSSQE